MSDSDTNSDTESSSSEESVKSEKSVSETSSISESESSDSDSETCICSNCFRRFKTEEDLLYHKRTWCYTR